MLWGRDDKPSCSPILNTYSQISDTGDSCCTGLGMNGALVAERERPEERDEMTKPRND